MHSNEGMSQDCTKCSQDEMVAGVPQVYKHHCDAAFDVENGAKGKMSPAIRYMSFDGEVPKRHLDRSRAGFGAFASIRDP